MDNNKNGLSLFNAIGSAASIVALAVVFVDKATANISIEPQRLIWQIALTFISIMATGATIIITFYKLKAIIVNDKFSEQKKTLLFTLTLIIGISFIAIFVDGIYCAIKWYPWPLDLLDFLWMF
ncbi:MAG TPA: hypothetical protein VHT96_00640 [Clostridia bacterium]|nr:hypothetical protein [Clostridia bacterium]